MFEFVISYNMMGLKKIMHHLYFPRSSFRTVRNKYTLKGRANSQQLAKICAIALLIEDSDIQDVGLRPIALA